MATTPDPKKAAQNARTKLIVFAIVVVGLLALMAGTKSWTPRLGLDLRGGTTITLTATDAQNGGRVNPDSLRVAADIITKRVDSLGVGESSVTVQGDRQIEVSVPNISGDELIELVGSTARLNFRGVYYYMPAESIAEQPTTDPSASPSASASASPTAAASTAGRRVAPELPPEPPPSFTPRPTQQEGELPPIDSRMAYQPSEQDLTEFQDFKCGQEFPDVEGQPLIACDEKGEYKYLLGPVLISGERLTDAQAGIPQGQLRWVVSLQLDDQGSKDFQTVSSQLISQQEPRNQFAIVLDSKVLMAPRMEAQINDGRAQISGDNINEESARTLASTLRYGALPVNLSVDSVDTISPTLGGEQLRAGLIAGLIGLGLVVVWSLLYYRGLTLVVVGSLIAAAAVTYAVLVLLGDAVGFALNLPGIAGAIVAIGVTADSFIVYFERIRDEIREGHNLRYSIESGWTKARNTVLMADGVQLLAAVVLYILSVGGVKGFAFTLGVTTAIDLFLMFFLTHPLMHLLGRTKFFGEGHPWSGFDPEHLGVSRESLLGRRRKTGSAAKSARKSTKTAELGKHASKPAKASTTQVDSERAKATGSTAVALAELSDDAATASAVDDRVAVVADHDEPAKTAQPSTDPGADEADQAGADSEDEVR